MQPLKSGIYKLYFLNAPDKIYIGSSINIDTRIQRHIWELTNNCHFNFKLQNNFNKYKPQIFIATAVIYCPVESLLSWEQFFIDKCNPSFNILKIAGSSLGYNHTIKTKIKMQNNWRMKHFIPGRYIIRR